MLVGIKRVLLVFSLVGTAAGCVLDAGTEPPQDEQATQAADETAPRVTQTSEWSPVPCCTEAPCGELPICEVNN